MENNLAEILAKRNLTMKFLERETKLNYHVIERIKKNRYRRQIPKQYIEKIAKVLNLTIEEIVGDMYDKTNNQQRGKKI